VGVMQGRAQPGDQGAHLIGHPGMANQLGAQDQQAHFGAGGGGDIFRPPEAAHEVVALFAEQLKAVMAGADHLLFVQARVGRFDQVGHLELRFLPLPPTGIAESGEHQISFGTAQALVSSGAKDLTSWSSAFICAR